MRTISSTSAGVARWTVAVAMRAIQADGLVAGGPGRQMWAR
jgi:hypothetical protein